MRYLIAILLPPPLESLLRQTYERTFHRPCRVRTLHITYIPPFSVERPDSLDLIQSTLKQLPTFETQFSYTSVGTFNTPSRQILYVAVSPIQPLQQSYQSLLTTIRPHLTIEATDFKKNELPKFLPHTTLDYNFTGDSSRLTPPSARFTLPKPELLFEAGPGIWKPL